MKVEAEIGVICIEDSGWDHKPRWPLEPKKCKDADSPLGPSEGTSLTDTLTLA